MNRDEGQYQLSHVFDDLLKKSSGNFVAIKATVNISCTQKIVTHPLVLIMMTASRRNVHTVSAILD